MEIVIGQCEMAEKAKLDNLIHGLLAMLVIQAKAIADFSGSASTSSGG